MGKTLPKGVTKHTVYTKTFETKDGTKTFPVSATGAGFKKSKASSKPKPSSKGTKKTGKK